MIEFQIKVHSGTSPSGGPRLRSEHGQRSFQTRRLGSCAARVFSVAGWPAGCTFQEGPCRDVVAAS